MIDQYEFDLKEMEKKIAVEESPEMAAEMRRFVRRIEDVNEDRTLSREERRLKRRAIYDDYCKSMLEILSGNSIEGPMFIDEEPLPEVGTVYEVLGHLKEIRNYQSNLGVCERLINSGELQPELAEEMSCYIEKRKYYDRNPEEVAKWSWWCDNIELAFMEYVNFAIDFYLQRASRESLDKYKPKNFNPKTDAEEKLGFLQWLTEHNFIDEDKVHWIRPVIRTPEEEAEVDLRMEILREYREATEAIDADSTLSPAEKEQRGKAAKDRFHQKLELLDTKKKRSLSTTQPDSNKPKGLVQTVWQDWKIAHFDGNFEEYLIKDANNFDSLSDEELENLRIVVAHLVERSEGKVKTDEQLIEEIKQEYKSRGNYLEEGLFDIPSLFYRGRKYFNDESLGKKALILKLIENAQKRRKNKPRDEGAELDKRINEAIRARNAREKELREIGASEEEIRYEINIRNEKIRELQEKRRKFL
jgi:hypothetical protein